MAASREIEGAAIVLLGAFNPAILHPLWFETNGLLPPEMCSPPTPDLVVTGQLAKYSTEWLELQVIEQQCVFATPNPAYSGDLRDLAIGTFKLLSHTPVQAVGINRHAHWKAPSERAWHAFGDRVAPKALWREVVPADSWSPREEGDPEYLGLRTFTIEVSRDPATDGYLRVEVAPSSRLGPTGIYVGVNDHFQLSEGVSASDGQAAARLIEREWDASQQRAEEIMSKLMATVVDG